MSNTPLKSLTLAERIKRLFIRQEDNQAAMRLLQEEVPRSIPAVVPQEQMAFKAGASVTFITPIGAYAGNPEHNSVRARAEQQFLQMNTHQNTTIN